MNFPRARWKLDEARFFLGFLDDMDDKLFERRPRAFNFLLSAFLNATYSVREMVDLELTQQLRKQGQKGTGGVLAAKFLASWEAGLEPEDLKIWGWMPGQRHAEVHKKGVELHTAKKLEPVRRSPDYEYYAQGHYHPAYYMQMMSVSPALLGIPLEQQVQVPPGVWREALMHEFKVGEERRQVVGVCDQYCGLLEQLILAAEEAA
jgi:hypothetical protein